MYCIRNPQINITDLIPALIDLAFQSPSSSSLPSASPAVARLLKGRMLWCAAACCECVGAPTDQNAKIKNQIVDVSIETLKKSKITSIKLVATRTLVKYARKMKKEDLHENAVKFEAILDNLLGLLNTSNKDVMHLPIEAFQTFSKVNEKTVSQMAPKITPNLLRIFKNDVLSS